jgi:hypothetical protein
MPLSSLDNRDESVMSIAARMYRALFKITLCLDAGPNARQIANSMIKELNINHTHIGQEALGIKPHTSRGKRKAA